MQLFKDLISSLLIRHIWKQTVKSQFSALKFLLSQIIITPHYKLSHFTLRLEYENHNAIITPSVILSKINRFCG